ncbi:amidohydrolase family protein [Vogesella sp. LIG4]|uniref:amidohydrolase family protein n=1 Tax=Vogesella sp. LIG4 TaxID=1192162 RepID=UPI00081FC7AC|nr:amidohydrolase family protein [Vogesella sp. LIG4]SCK25583.1 cytosine deaminase [Vogesella sp. LIG4]
MHQSIWLRNVRPYGGAAEDIEIVNGRIGQRRAAQNGPLAGGDIDGGGRLLTLPLVDAHTHLDKTLWSLPWHSHTAGDSLQSLIDNERRILRETSVPIAVRAGALLEHCIARGTQLLRCHVDADPALGWEHIEATLQLRERYADLIDIEFVTFPQGGLTIRPGALQLMRQAVEAGMEVVGGLDPCGIDKDPIAHLTQIFELAREYGRGVDIHLHDGGELGLWQVARICDFTERYQRQGKVVISHGFCLGMRPWDEVAPLAARLAANGISIATTAPGEVEAPPFDALSAAGVNICLGNDGIRDAWSPLGNGDMLERVMLQAYRFYVRTDAGLQAAFDAGSVNGARAMGRSDFGLEAGQRASFLLFDAETLGEAIVMRPPDRTVIRDGRVIARGGKLLESRLPGA